MYTSACRKLRIILAIGILAGFLLYLPLIDSAEAGYIPEPLDVLPTMMEIPQGSIVLAGIDDILSLTLLDPTTGLYTFIPNQLAQHVEGIAIDAAGNIIVSDTMLPGIILIDPTNPLDDKIIASGGLIQNPLGITIDASGDIIIADYLAGLIRVDPDTGADSLIKSLDADFYQPTDVLINDEGNFIVSSNEHEQIFVIDSITGNLLDTKEAGVGLSQRSTGPTTTAEIQTTPISLTTTDTQHAGALGTYDNNWSIPKNSLGDDSATCAAVDGAGRELFVNTFGFNIPLDATIDGIEVQVEFVNESGEGTNGIVNIGKAEGKMATSKDMPVKFDPGKDCAVTKFMTFGGISDLWGASWTPADINSNSFTVYVDSTDSSFNLISKFRVLVTYTTTTSSTVIIDPTKAYVNESTGLEEFATSEGQLGMESIQAYQSFNFNIPYTADVLGLEVELDHAHTDDSKTGVWNVKLLDDVGNQTGTASIGTDDGHSDFETERLGGDSELWGADLSPSILNDPDFGIKLDYSATEGSSSNDGLLDYAGVTIYYDDSTLVQSSSSGILTYQDMMYFGETDIIKQKTTGTEQELFSSGYDQIESIVADADGNLIVLDSGASTLYKVDSVFGVKSVIDVDSKYQEYVTDLAVIPNTVVLDADGDGILDRIDTSLGTYSDDVSDIPLGGTTSLSIVSRGDRTLAIMDLPGKDGVYVSAYPTGTVDAEISVCSGASTIYLGAGDIVYVTCGSVILEVIRGVISSWYADKYGNTVDTVLDEQDELYFDPDNFVFESRGGDAEITITTGSGSAAEVNLGKDNKILFDSDTSTVTSSDSTIDKIDIMIDGEASTLLPGESSLVGDSKIEIPVVEESTEDTIVNVTTTEPIVEESTEDPIVNVTTTEPIVDESVVVEPVEKTTSILDEDVLNSKQDKEEAKKQAIKELKKKQKDKANKKSELTSQRNELKKLRHEMTMMDKESIISDELNEKFEGLVSQIQATLNILNSEFDYEKESKNELAYELKIQKETLFDTETVSEKNFRHKIGSKLSLLSQSSDPINFGKDMGIKFKNGKTTISLSFSKDNPDVLEHLNSIGRVDAASGNHVQLTLNLEDLHNLKSIPGLEKVTQVVPGIQNVENLD